ncbi:glycine-rich cell wall structural protein 1.0-like [Pyrus ussuriensis x Pyrus communis]|uniref:Glycine-rich cell wall structural protein 1.0-like n=1 Tax=Pyrus ussuriensis x Pyrus communis TaxID=2448454 RepID=A0A5N5F917_9ROSA|nr:glycine-rich cell wall structural protein 1.0-like [Pyrus ussuriensis x Pyrus communis]
MEEIFLVLLLVVLVENRTKRAGYQLEEVGTLQLVEKVVAMLEEVMTGVEKQ